jgi:hypothetical protein
LLFSAFINDLGHKIPSAYGDKLVKERLILAIVIILCPNAPRRQPYARPDRAKPRIIADREADHAGCGAGFAVDCHRGASAND